jgi:hypothetical protein
MRRYSCANVPTRHVAASGEPVFQVERPRRRGEASTTDALETLLNAAGAHNLIGATNSWCTLAPPQARSLIRTKPRCHTSYHLLQHLWCIVKGLEMNKSIPKVL